MSSYYSQREKRGPSGHGSGSNQRAVQHSSNIRDMANLSISKKPPAKKSSADAEWDQIEDANPKLYDAILRASGVWRKLEAEGRIRPFRVQYPRIQPAPPPIQKTRASRTNTPAYTSQDAQRSRTVGGPSLRGPSTGSSYASTPAPRGDRHVSDKKYSSPSTGSYACKYCGKTYDTRDRRAIHEGKHR